MLNGKTPTILFLLLIANAVGYTQQISGMIRKKEPAGVLSGAVATNISNGKSALADKSGYYKLNAKKGDTVVFSYPGYWPDTVLVSNYYLEKGFTVTLTSSLRILPAFQVYEKNNYQVDSMQRRDEYAHILNRLHPVKLMNEKRPNDNTGLNFSPLGYFSKTEKGKRRLQKRFAEAEQDYYIDYKFSPAKVAQLTRLKGDSLQLFLIRYRPSYPYCRTASNQDMLLYVNDKLKLFKQAKSE